MKITELQEEEKQRIAYLYYEVKMSAKLIIEKFQLEVRPTWLTRELSWIKSFDVCERCGEFMHKKLETKKSSEDERESECRSCGNRRVGEWKFPQEFANREHKEKRSLIEAYYCGRPNLKRFEDLDMEEQIQVLFLAIYKMRVAEERAFFLGRKEFNPELIFNLLDRDIILISARSPIESFDSKDFPQYFDLYEVFYKLNISCDRETMQELNANSFFWKRYDLERIAKYFKRMLCQNLCNDIKLFLEEKNTKYTSSLLSEFNLVNALGKKSYTQFIGLRDSMFLGEPRLTSRHSHIIYSLLQACDHKNINVNEVPRELIYLSDDLFFFIARVLGQNLEILKEPVTVENMEKWKEQALGNKADNDSDGWKAFVRANDSRNISRQEIIDDIMKYGNVSKNAAKYIYVKHVDIGTLFEQEIWYE